MTKLFIDDERFPPEDGSGWVIVRSSHEAIEWVKANGIPDFISFDHDLGGDDTSKTFIRWLMEQVMDGVLKFPPWFGFYVHSQNPIGAEWIRSTMSKFHFIFGENPDEI